MAENFFDFQQRIAQRKAGAAPAADQADALTVTQLTAAIDRAIKLGVPSAVTVRGEVSNVSDRHGSGHLYFTMKDAGACINCVMWRDNASRLRFRLEDGLEIIAAGRVTLYAPQGRYQLAVQNIQPAGRGALELAFRQLQAKLSAEGLFAPERKKALPRYPARIVMVTSRATAALQDMLKVLRRFNWLKLTVYHVPVQGEGSGAKIAEAIEHLSARVDDIGGADIILLARGGGSLEDLWAFNEEAVARAVAASRIPVVTGIGHEVDCSISDLVADYHAHTPTEAAQVVTQHWKLAAEMLSQGRSRLGRLVKQAAVDSQNRLTQIYRHEFFRRPLDRIQMLRQLLDDRQKAITLALSARREKARDKLRAMEPRLAGIEKAILQSRLTQLQSMERHIEALSPAGVLKRGYSITTLKKSGEILRNAQQVRPGDRLLTRVAEGEIQSVVDDAKQMGLFE